MPFDQVLPAAAVTILLSPTYHIAESHQRNEFKNVIDLSPAMPAAGNGRKKTRRSGFFLPGDYLSNLRITRVALVPPKPKLLDITVVSARWVGWVMISMPSAFSSSVSTLMLGAMKLFSNISRL